MASAPVISIACTAHPPTPVATLQLSPAKWIVNGIPFDDFLGDPYGDGIAWVHSKTRRRIECVGSPNTGDSVWCIFSSGTGWYWDYLDREGRWRVPFGLEGPSANDYLQVYLYSDEHGSSDQQFRGARTGSIFFDNRPGVLAYAGMEIGLHNETDPFPQPERCNSAWVGPVISWGLGGPIPSGGIAAYPPMPTGVMHRPISGALRAYPPGYGYPIVMRPGTGRRLDLTTQDTPSGFGAWEIDRFNYAGNTDPTATYRTDREPASLRVVGWEVGGPSYSARFDVECGPGHLVFDYFLFTLGLTLEVWIDGGKSYSIPPNRGGWWTSGNVSIADGGPHVVEFRAVAGVSTYGPADDAVWIDNVKIDNLATGYSPAGELRPVPPRGIWRLPPGARTAQSVVRVILTGEADGLPDVDLPTSYVVLSLKDSDRVRISAFVPGVTAWASSVAERSHGTLRVLAGVRSVSGIEQLEEIAAAELSSASSVAGGRSSSISLTAYRAYERQDGIVRALGSPESSAAYHTGKRSWVFPAIDEFLRPGDTAMIDGEAVSVSEVQIEMWPDRHRMTVRD